MVFGAGGFAEVVEFYLTHDSDYEVVGFAATGEIEAGAVFRHRPLVAFETIEQVFAPGEVDMFIAVGYRKMNSIRAEFMAAARAKGYSLLSYVCSKATHWIGPEDGTQIGENVFVFEDNTLQPFLKIGDGTILWSGNHLGHHSEIGQYCFIASHAVISGHCRLGDYCFVGVNATISEGVSIGERNIIGPGSLIQKDTKDAEVYLAERTKAHARDSSRFLR